MPIHNYGKVPMYKMKPHKGFFITAVVILILGLLFFFEGHRDPGDIPAHERSNMVLVVAVIVSGLLFMVSTGRMWFKHLWHDRYR